jgi:glycosyltransferase involved in cell wall biosynthesis
MKILLDAHMLEQKETGNERYWKNLALSLSKFINPKNIILYSNLPKEKLPEEFQKFTVFTPKFKNGLYRIFFGFNQTIKKFKPDLIHVQNFAPFKKIIPIVNTVHDICFKTYSKTFSTKSKISFNLFFNLSLKKSDVVIVPSHFVKNMLLKCYPFLNEKKIFVTYEAADLVFKYIKNKKKVKKFLKEKFNISNNYFLVVGNIESRKRPKEIIEAFKKILKKYPKTLLVFAGPNKLKLKEERSIRILEYVSDKELNYLYNGALALIYFSLCEGFGLPLVEALKTKTQIICSDIPVFKEIVKNIGLFAKNKVQLTQKMLLVLDSNKDKIKFNYLLRKKTKNKFDWLKMSKQIKNIYKKILKNTPIYNLYNDR